MTPQQFIAKWQRAKLSERSACQQHFLDLCDLLDQKKPAAADPDGDWYRFERGVDKEAGGKGWADVWMRGHFGWEYKGKHKDLLRAYDQLLQYRESLENPPLLVVCDLDRNTAKRSHTKAQGRATHPGSASHPSRRQSQRDCTLGALHTSAFRSTGATSVPYRASHMATAGPASSGTRRDN